MIFCNKISIANVKYSVETATAPQWLYQESPWRDMRGLLRRFLSVRLHNRYPVSGSWTCKECPNDKKTQMIITRSTDEHLFVPERGTAIRDVVISAFSTQIYPFTNWFNCLLRPTDSISNIRSLMAIYHASIPRTLSVKLQRVWTEIDWIVILTSQSYFPLYFRSAHWRNHQ